MNYIKKKKVLKRYNLNMNQIKLNSFKQVIKENKIHLFIYLRYYLVSGTNLVS